ncbi:MAG: TRAP transporter permease [Pseudomonadota bacterium]
MTERAEPFDANAAAELEKRYDSGLQVREHGPILAKFLYGFAVAFALYHYYTAGFGLPVDYWHMGIHLAGLAVLILTCFPLFKSNASRRYNPDRWWRFGNVPIYDWVFAALGVLGALYLGFSWQGLDWPWLGLQLSEQALRQGDPAPTDIFFGTIVVVLALEMARRSIGPVLPLIILGFILFALLGPYMPIQILKHPGVDWRQFINNMYFPSEGIFGKPLWIVSTVVLHFVLFGVIAQRMGLGQFFIDNAMILAGRYTGGPAKVSVVSSAFFGTISGSSIANTVSTGSLTIPNMKRLGYPGHFAGGVEAAASAGGQITPPIMGAASFIMAEFLEVPYSTIVIAAIVPALMHYIGVIGIVHFQAKRLGLEGYAKDMLPNLRQVWVDGWPTMLPLVALIWVLFSGNTPYMAAFMGITLCIIVGFVSWRQPLSLAIPIGAASFVSWRYGVGNFDVVQTGVLLTCIVLGTIHRRERKAWRELFDSLHLGVQYALAVGGAVTAVGIVVGVINTTGLGFRMGALVTNGARDMAETLLPLFAWMPTALVGDAFSLTSLQLFLSLSLIAMACIFMGAGLPTTALYIMLVSVAQPPLAQLGVPALASHMFVLYYGVISEITPPVCASAYAAAGIAGANPFRTGISAFTLGLAKLMVPMVFVYQPAMLIVLPEYFTWWKFIHVSLTCATGILMIATAVTGYFLANMGVISRLAMAFAGLFLVAPGFTSDMIALALAAPVIIAQLMARRDQPKVTTAGE